MAFEQLFIRTKKEIGGVQLDAFLVEDHSNEVSITTNPVELGADITDHSIIQPKTLRITGVVSDTPLGTAAFGEIVDNVTGFFGTATTDNLTRSQAAYGALILLQEQREPITVQTKLALYENMLITNLSVAQDKNSSRVIEVQMTLREIRIVQSELIEVTDDQLAGSAKVQASPPKQRGRTEPAPPTEGVNRSILQTGLKWISS